MTARVYWMPKEHHLAVPFQRLGETEEGLWGLVEDGAWIAAPDAAALELLYLNKAEYRHATRRLQPSQVALAIEHRRKTFWETLASYAPGYIQEAIWRCIDRADDDARGLRLRAKLLTLHAKFVDVNRLAGQPLDDQLFSLYALDCELLADLGCRSLQQVYAVDKDGKERDFRRRFLEDPLSLPSGAKRAPRVQLHLPIRRGFAVRPITEGLRFKAKLAGEPCSRWRNMLLVGLTDEDLEELSSYRARLLYARSTEIFYGAVEELTQAQLDIELEERLAAPDLYHHFMSSRICTASAREGLRLLTRENKEVNRVLSRQIEEELRGLGAFRKPPPAKPTLDEMLTELLALIDLRVAIVLRREGMAWAADMKTLGLGIRKLRESDER